jgi:hypothetical protein
MVLADAQALVGDKRVDTSLDVEQRDNALDRLQRHRRDRRRALAAPRVRGNVGKLEELPPGVRPTQCRRDRARSGGGS